MESDLQWRGILSKELIKNTQRVGFALKNTPLHTTRKELVFWLFKFLQYTENDSPQRSPSHHWLHLLLWRADSRGDSEDLSLHVYTVLRDTETENFKAHRGGREERRDREESWSPCLSCRSFLCTQPFFLTIFTLSQICVLLFQFIRECPSADTYAFTPGP